ncbi:hypothetical protein [Paenibacillus anaericanus]|uniref:hypothetical protein n=1 Tax=Paenibacillus anaericanus TaxID=170367 RepID=UPI000FC995A1|nr:hypothetical protein [Paenibacillus anaericanus]
MGGFIPVPFAGDLLKSGVFNAAKVFAGYEEYKTEYFSKSAFKKSKKMIGYVGTLGDSTELAGILGDYTKAGRLAKLAKKIGGRLSKAATLSKGGEILADSNYDYDVLIDSLLDREMRSNSEELLLSKYLLALPILKSLVKSGDIDYEFDFFSQKIWYLDITKTKKGSSKINDLKEMLLSLDKLK